MSILRELAARALLGTDKRPGPLPEGTGEIGRILHDIAMREDRSDFGEARKVLRMAGVLSICALAGYRPLEEKTPRLIPCQPETGKQPSSPVKDVLETLLREENPLLRTALRLLRASRYVLPPALLPQALELARRDRSLRPLVGAVAGERGRWLAAANPEWSAMGRYVVGNEPLDAEHWEHGSRGQRRDYFAEARRENPEQGRRLLRESLPELDVEERQELLQCCADGLSGEDEAFLEEILLRDRAKSVKSAAAALLVRLTESRYVARMTARLDACLISKGSDAGNTAPGSSAKAFLARVSHTLGRADGAGIGLSVEPPSAFEAEWKKDLLEARKANSEPLGERGWWLFQIARAVPLAWWERRTGMEPRELLAWAGTLEWKDALVRAWLTTLEREPDPRWTLALSECVGERRTKDIPCDIFDLLGILPPEQQDVLWSARLRAVVKKCDGRRESDEIDLWFSRMVELLKNADRTVSEEFGREIVHALHCRAKCIDIEPHMKNRIMPWLACLLPIDLVEMVEAGWPRDEDGTPRHYEALRAFTAVGRQRQILHQLLDGDDV